ncbi:hypothetical protein BN1708_003689, partial [Verticillium longisporum]
LCPCLSTGRLGFLADRSRCSSPFSCAVQTKYVFEAWNTDLTIYMISRVAKRSPRARNFSHRHRLLTDLVIELDSVAKIEVDSETKRTTDAPLDCDENPCADLPAI